MGREAAGYISDIDPTWPLNTDNVSQGDDHLRNFKKSVQDSFPNIDGPVTATPDQLNNAINPPGMISTFGGEAIPTGWLWCNGVSVSRTTYAALYAQIGTTYGNGDGSTTFGLPDSRDRVMGGSGVLWATGAIDGKNDWTEGDMPKHRHLQLRRTQAENAENVEGGTFFYSVTEGDFDNMFTNYVGTNATADNKQETLFVRWFIKT